MKASLFALIAVHPLPSRQHSRWHSLSPSRWFRPLSSPLFRHSNRWRSPSLWFRCRHNPFLQLSRLPRLLSRSLMPHQVTPNSLTEQRSRRLHDASQVRKVLVTLLTAAIYLLFSVFTGLAGIILAIISLTKKNCKLKPMAIIGLIACAIGMVYSILMWASFWSPEVYNFMEPIVKYLY